MGLPGFTTSPCRAARSVTMPLAGAKIRVWPKRAAAAAALASACASAARSASVCRCCTGTCLSSCWASASAACAAATARCDRLDPGLRRRHGAPGRLHPGLRRLFVGLGGIEIGLRRDQVLRRVDVLFDQRPDAVEVVLGLGHRRLGLRHLRLRLPQLGLGLRHLRLRLLQLGLGLRHLRLRLADLSGQRILQQLGLGRRLLRAGAGLRDGVAGGALVGAQLVLIEHGNQVAGLNPLPVVHRQAHDAAGDLAAHHHFVAIHGAGQHERLRTRTLEPPDRHGDGHNQRQKDRSFHAERPHSVKSKIHCKPNHCESKLNQVREAYATHASGGFDA